LPADDNFLRDDQLRGMKARNGPALRVRKPPAPKRTHAAAIVGVSRNARTAAFLKPLPGLKARSVRAGAVAFVAA
jgi:hypothetical protein